MGHWLSVIEVIDLAEITRRDFFRKLYSKDTVKDVFGTLYGFKEEFDNASKPSGDEAIFRIVKNMRRGPNIQQKRERRDKE